MNNESKSSIKKGFFVSLIVLIGKVLGFVKQSVIAWAFGTTSGTDIYFAADGYTSMFGQVMSQSISPSVLTNYVTLDEQKKKEEAVNLIRSCFIFFPLLALTICIISIALSSLLSQLLGLSYTIEQRHILQIYLISLCPIIFLTALTGVSQGYLEANQKFYPAKLCSLFFSISIIIFVVVFKDGFGVNSLLIGFLVGYVAHTFFMLFIVFRKFKFRFVNPFKNIYFKKLLIRFFPLMIGVSIVDLGHFVDRIIASSLEDGSISILYYGQVVSTDLISSVIITTICIILLPSFTRMVANKMSQIDIIKKISLIFSYVCMFIIALSGLYIIEGFNLVKLFFERGNFTSSDSQLVYLVVCGYAYGFIFLAIREILVRCHYAYGDTLRPMINSIIGVVINIVLSIILSRFLGTYGIAIATTISNFIIMILSFITLRKHITMCFFKKEFIVSLIKVFIAFSITFVLCYFAEKNLEFNYIIKLFLISFIYVFLYFIILFIIREKYFLSMISKIFKKKRLENEQ